MAKYNLKRTVAIFICRYEYGRGSTTFNALPTTGTTYFAKNVAGKKRFCGFFARTCVTVFKFVINHMFFRMPKYFCDYCDTYLTHDSPSVSFCTFC